MQKIGILEVLLELLSKSTSDKSLPSSHFGLLQIHERLPELMLFIKRQVKLPGSFLLQVRLHCRE